MTYECSKCGEWYGVFYGEPEHETICKRTFVCSCEKCGKMFDNDKGLQKHRSRHQYCNYKSRVIQASRNPTNNQ